MPVGELLSRISSRELSEWMAYFEIEPFGADAYYLGHAIVAKTVADSNRKKGSKPYKVEDFMPKFEKPKSVDQAIQFAQMMTLAMGGEDMRDG